MLNLSTCYRIAQLQAQLLEGQILFASGLFERKEDWRDAPVARDGTGKFASKGMTSSQESAQSLLASLFNLRISSPPKQSPQKLFDNIKNGIDRLKDAKLPVEAQAITDQVVANAVPAGIYLARTVAPDVLIGLSLGESIPIVLGGAAVFTAVGLATDKTLEELDINSPWAKAAANIAVSLIVSDVVRGINGAIAWNKFADSGVFPTIKPRRGNPVVVSSTTNSTSKEVLTVLFKASEAHAVP